MRFNLLFWIILACGFLGGVFLGVRWQARQPQDIRPEFRSLARLVVTWDQGAKDGDQAVSADFYGTCIEALESAEMKRRALERVRILNRDLKEQDVDIRAARKPGSGIISVLATGDEAKYTRVFLDALLDEYLSSLQSVREARQGRVLQVSLEEVVALQKSMEEAVVGRARARAAVPAAEGPAELERLTARLIKLRDERDDLRAQSRKSAAAEPELRTTQALKAVEQEISSQEEHAKRLGTALQELQGFEELRTAVVKRYETKLAEVEALQKQFALETGPVAIQERATAASMTLFSPTLPVFAGGFFGGALGGVAGLIAACIASWRPSKAAPLES